MHARRTTRILLLLILAGLVALPASAATIFTNIVTETPTTMRVDVAGGAIQNGVNAPGNAAQNHNINVAGLNHWSINLGLREVAGPNPEEDGLGIDITVQHLADASWPAGPVFNYTDDFGFLTPAPTQSSTGFDLVNTYDVTINHQTFGGQVGDDDRVRIQFFARWDILTSGTPQEAAGLQIRDYKFVIEAWHGDPVVPEPGVAGLLATALLALSARRARGSGLE